MAAFHAAALTDRDRTLLAWLDAERAPALRQEGCCAAFRAGAIAASIHDPRVCIRCAPARYGWRRVVFGRIRRVSSGEAAHWKEPSDG